MTTTRYLIIDKINEVYLKIEADADIRRELANTLPLKCLVLSLCLNIEIEFDGKIRLFNYASVKYMQDYILILLIGNKNDVQIVDALKLKMLI